MSGKFMVETSRTRAGSSPAAIRCAPSAPRGNATTAPGSSPRSPSGVRRRQRRRARPAAPRCRDAGGRARPLPGVELVERGAELGRACGGAHHLALDAGRRPLAATPARTRSDRPSHPRPGRDPVLGEPPVLDPQDVVPEQRDLLAVLQHPTPVQRAATSAPSTSGPTAKVKSSVENIARVSRISSTSASCPATSRSGQCPTKSSVRISSATSYEPCQSSSNQRSYSTFAILTANGRPGPARARRPRRRGIPRGAGAGRAGRGPDHRRRAVRPGSPARLAAAEQDLRTAQRWNPDTNPALDLAIAEARAERYEQAGARIVAVTRKEPENARACQLLCSVAKRYDSGLAATACARVRDPVPPSLNRSSGRSTR